MAENVDKKIMVSVEIVDNFVNAKKNVDYWRKSLKDAKVIECELLLSELDIQEFRKVENDTSGYFTPVYIEYFGKFFYVNKISNFGASPITKVELVKL